MPCYQTGSRLGDAELSAKEACEEATKLTRLLCEAMTKLDEYGNDAGQMPSLSKELRDWWAKHQKIDKARLSREAEQRRLRGVRMGALRKLTDEEKKALGVRRGSE